MELKREVDAFTKDFNAPPSTIQTLDRNSARHKLSNTGEQTALTAAADAVPNNS